MALCTTAFWQEAGKQMGIMKDNMETDMSFCCRVMFSALSKWVLTAVGGSNQSVSIVKIQQIIEEKLENYLKMLPKEDTINPGIIENTIYQTLLDNGAFYHIQYNIQSVPHKLIGCGEVSLVRGLKPEEKANFSGLAPFILKSSAEESMTDGFMLWSLSGRETIDLIWRRSIPVDNSVNLEEYLNLERTSGRYFTGKRTLNGSFTLARSRKSGNTYNHEYYVIMGDEVRRIPEDYKDASIHEYARLAMMNNVRKQTVIASIRENIVPIECGYLLPAPDLRFMRFVSWPVDFADMNNDFRFMLHPAVWPAIKNRLTLLGYEVQENHD